MLFRQRYEEDLRLIGSLQAWVFAGLGALVLLLLPLVAPGYFLYNMTLFFVYATVAISLMLLVGYTGQVSLGHAGFLAAGAYTVGLLTNLGWPFLLALAASFAISALLGLVIGVPALRLEGPYLAIATLGFALMLQQLLNNWGVVGASSGMLVDRPAFLGIEFWRDGPYYYLVLAFTALVAWLSFNLVRSHVGRAFMAVRDADTAAQMSGVNLAFYKTAAFVISAGFAGLAGGLYGPLLGYITPEGFNLLLSVKFLLMVVIGGLGFLPGAILGAALVVALEVNLSGFRNLSQLFFGLIVIALMMVEPLGLYGRWMKIQRYWKSWPM